MQTLISGGIMLNHPSGGASAEIFPDKEVAPEDFVLGEHYLFYPPVKDKAYLKIISFRINPKECIFKGGLYVRRHKGEYFFLGVPSNFSPETLEIERTTFKVTSFNGIKVTLDPIQDN